MNRSLFSIAIPFVLMAGLSTPATGRAQVVYNFASSNGGLTASQQSGSNPEGAWSYGTSFPSVGGTATWATPGNSQAATAYALTTPVLTVQANGQVTGSFLHRFSFEANFDGGLLTYAVNGGSFNMIASGLLTGQMYNGATGLGTPIGFGVPAFTGTSAGYATPAYVTTGFTLGTGAGQTFAAGDSIQFQFLAEFDGGVVGSSPNWQIATLSFGNVAVPEPGSMMLCGLALAGASLAGWRKRRAAQVS